MLLLLFVINLICCEVVQVYVFTRHCDRTPMQKTILPKCPVDIFKKLNLPESTLTPLGEKQCYQMGTSIRDRYLNPSSGEYIRNISTLYHPNDYHFAADYCGRTMRSLQSATLGMFPTGHKISVPPYDYALRNGTQSLPIYTIQASEDRTIVEYDLCPYIHEETSKWWESTEGKKVIEEFSETMDELYKMTGYKTDLRHITPLFDTICVLHWHQLLTSEIEEKYDQIKKVFDKFWYYTFLRERMGNLVGYYVSNIRDNMNDFIKGKSEPKKCLKYNALYDKCEATATIKKYIHVSGHDSGLGAIMSNLGLVEDYDELNIQARYGSALILELIEENGEYFVRVVFKDSFEGKFKSYKLNSYGGGCSQEKCPFNEFSKLVDIESYISTKNWCNKCENTKSNFCN